MLFLKLEFYQTITFLSYHKTINNSDPQIQNLPYALALPVV